MGVEEIIEENGRPLRAIDLYAGVGGWSLGLSLAGIEVVASYEWWSPACLTNRANGGHTVLQRDIRSLDLGELPSNIDIVVGSPPCTQFSLANRGGSGDLADGVRDLRAFLRIVARLRPRYWVFENVVRAAQIFEREVYSGSLSEFAWLTPTVHVVDASRFGIPQRRTRAFVGNIDFNLLEAYSSAMPQKTLGEVIASVNSQDACVADPTWGWGYGRGAVTDVDHEVPLTPQETRLNRDAKANNPIYNGMAFPDDLNRPSRTVTATCTRVSRESIVVEMPGRLATYRRLSVRERAALQGFPLWFQFLGETHTQKLKMIGNAVPPSLTFLVAQAIKQVSPPELRQPMDVGRGKPHPLVESTRTTPDVPRQAYKADRTFAAAIPNLRFKSGTRFEVSNRIGPDTRQAWACRFFWGSSKDVRSLVFSPVSLKALVSAIESKESQTCLIEAYHETAALAASTLPGNLQLSWTGSAESNDAHAFVDWLGEIALRAEATLRDSLDTSGMLRIQARISLMLAAGKPSVVATIPRKIHVHARSIAVGIAIAAGVNGAWDVDASLGANTLQVSRLPVVDMASPHLVQAALAI